MLVACRGAIVFMDRIDYAKYLYWMELVVITTLKIQNLLQGLGFEPVLA